MNAVWAARGGKLTLINDYPDLLDQASNRLEELTATADTAGSPIVIEKRRMGRPPKWMAEAVGETPQVKRRGRPPSNGKKKQGASQEWKWPSQPAFRGTNCLSPLVPGGPTPRLGQSSWRKF